MNDNDDELARRVRSLEAERLRPVPPAKPHTLRDLIRLIATLAGDLQKHRTTERGTHERWPDVTQTS